MYLKEYVSNKYISLKLLPYHEINQQTLPTHTHTKREPVAKAMGDWKQTRIAPSGRTRDSIKKFELFWRHFAGDDHSFCLASPAAIQVTLHLQ